MTKRRGERGQDWLRVRVLSALWEPVQDRHSPNIVSSVRRRMGSWIGESSEKCAALLAGFDGDSVGVSSKRQDASIGSVTPVRNMHQDSMNNILTKQENLQSAFSPLLPHRF